MVVGGVVAVVVTCAVVYSVCGDENSALSAVAVVASCDSVRVGDIGADAASVSVVSVCNARIVCPEAA